MSNESLTKTITVALVLSLLCGVLVSFAAISLKPLQTKNRQKELQKNILQIAGIPKSEPSHNIDVLFKKYINIHVIDLKTGKFDTTEDPQTYDFRKALRIPKQTIALSSTDDLAQIHHIPNKMPIYYVKINNEITRIVLPIYGKGLWSTLYGFLALNKDAKVVEGITFYEHAETPGLGGEVDNPKWKALWRHKELYNEQGEAVLQLSKVHVPVSSPKSRYSVDSLSGATMTSRGVQNLVRFWASKNGYAPFLQKFLQQQNKTEEPSTNLQNENEEPSTNLQNRTEGSSTNLQNKNETNA